MSHFFCIYGASFVFVLKYLRNLKTIINQAIDEGILPREKYVFPILDKNDTPEEEYAKTQQAVKTINKYTKRIGAELGFDMPLTTYVARYTFATILKLCGTPIPFIV